MEETCKVDGCGRKCYRKNKYCQRHFQQIKNHGEILKRTRFDPNEIIVKNNIAHIQLYDKNCVSTGKAIIDEEDVNKCRSYKWHLNKYGYVATDVKGKRIFLHNFILNRKASHKIQVDHKNQIKHDCRKSNLRLCTPNQNKYNVGLISTNTSGFKGIYFSKQTNKWVAQIIANGKCYSLGHFARKKEAAEMRDMATRKMHGDFAVLNFPNEV